MRDLLQDFDSSVDRNDEGSGAAEIIRTQAPFPSLCMFCMAAASDRVQDDKLPKNASTTFQKPDRHVVEKPASTEPAETREPIGRLLKG